MPKDDDIPKHMLERWQKAGAKELRAELKFLYRRWAAESDRVSRYERACQILRDMLNVEERSE